MRPRWEALFLSGKLLFLPILFLFKGCLKSVGSALLQVPPTPTTGGGPLPTAGLGKEHSWRQCCLHRSDYSRQKSHCRYVPLCERSKMGCEWSPTPQVAHGEHKRLREGSCRCDGACSMASTAAEPAAAPPNTQHYPQGMTEEGLQGMDLSRALPSQLVCEYLMLLFIHYGSYSCPHASAPRSQPPGPTLGLQLGRAAEAGSISCFLQGGSPVYSPVLLLPTPRQRCGLREWQHFPNPRAIDLE